MESRQQHRASVRKSMWFAIQRQFRNHNASGNFAWAGDMTRKTARRILRNRLKATND
jgi:hypothetical protein